MTIIELLEIAEYSIDEKLKSKISEVIKQLVNDNLNKDITNNNHLWVKFLDKIEAKKMSEKKIYY